MNEQDIPIDINTNKLLEWLISRRHVSKFWQDDIIKVREKINNAIQDMPEHEGIARLLTGQHINFFHCLKIVEILKETEADTKNLFGRYGSSRMKDWQDIVQCYQKEGLYLGEAAQMLIRNVSYEVPSLKKQIAKLETIQNEANKKIKDYTKNENVALNEFAAACKQLGIVGGKNIRNELVDLLKDLPRIYENVAEKLKLIAGVVKFYKAFVQMHSKEEEVKTLALLEYVIAKGNTTTYEYLHGRKPISIETPPVLTESESGSEEETPEIEIDFGEVEEKVDIDWGTIDYGNEDGFEIVDHSDLDRNSDDSDIARGDQALTVLDNPKLRQLALNQLVLLESFLTMRLYELSIDDDMLTMMADDTPANLQMQTLESVTCMLGNVKVVLEEYVHKRAQHLHNIKHSPKYVDILSSSLKQKLALVDRLKANKKILENKIKEAKIEAQKVRPTINLMVENTKTLQKNIEDDISKKYKGRPVHIVGAVNTL